MLRYLPLLLLPGLLLHSVSPAQETPVKPSATASAAGEYQGRVIAQTMHWQGAAWLIRNKREREEATTRMREELRLKTGMSVCDMGSGNGYHTLPMAEAVGGTGRVYAVDVQPEMIVMLNARIAEKAITHIEPIIGEVDDP